MLSVCQKVHSLRSIPGEVWVFCSVERLTLDTLIRLFIFSVLWSMAVCLYVVIENYELYYLVLTELTSQNKQATHKDSYKETAD